jgi:hypothetical protein
MSVNSREPTLPGGSSLSSGHGHQRGGQNGDTMPSTPGCREYGPAVPGRRYSPDLTDEYRWTAIWPRPDAQQVPIFTRRSGRGPRRTGS